VQDLFGYVIIYLISDGINFGLSVRLWASGGWAKQKDVLNLQCFSSEYMPLY